MSKCMKKACIILIINILFAVNLALQARPADVYLVIYATWNGHTGHAGIAMDTYKIVVRQKGNVEVQDTVATGKLVYFDLWPLQDNFALYSGRDVSPHYFRLPMSSSEAPITPASLMNSGIPHREGYACDGLIRIKASPTQTEALVRFLDQQMELQKPFNTISYNCADFAEKALEYVIHSDIQADEEVFLFQSTTPNRLYQVCAGLPQVTVLKDPGTKVNGSFVSERILR